MKPISILVSLVFVSFVTKISGQNIVINEDPQITKLMATYSMGTSVVNNNSGGIPTPVNNNANNGTFNAPNNTNAPAQIIDGFRIQLLASTDRRAVEVGQGTFSSRYPNTFATWVQAKPYYRLRIGGFNSRTDALKYLQVIKKDYPDAYVVPDKIKTTEITQF